MHASYICFRVLLSMFDQRVCFRLSQVTKMLFGLLFLLLVAQSAAILPLKTDDDLRVLRGTGKPYAILFFHEEKEHEPLKSKLLNFMRAAEEEMEIHQNPFIALAMLNCMAKGITAKNIEECQQGRRTFFAYKGGNKEKFDLRTLYDTTSFMSNILSFIYDEQMGLAQNKEDWRYLQSEQKGKKDVVFMFVNAIGSAVHYSFMNFASMHMNEYKFVYTTDRDFALALGMPSHLDFALWYVNCTQLQTGSEESCPMVPYTAQSIDTNSIITFVRTSGLPLVSDIKDDGKSIYENVNQLYIVVDNEENKRELRNVIEKVVRDSANAGIHFRGVVIDLKKHANLLPTFGIHDSSMLPTVIFEIFEDRHSPSRELEHFTLDDDLTEENIYKFVHSLTKDADGACALRASVYEISYMRLDQWEDMNNLKRIAISVGCSKDIEYEEACYRFTAAYRRLVRTMHESDSNVFEFYYVDFTGKPKSAVHYNIPVMNLHIPGKTDIKFDTTEENSYERMLYWINIKLGYSYQQLPVSCSDFVPIPGSNKFDINTKVIQDNKEILEIDNDEVSEDAFKVKRKFKEDSGKLTDATFNKTLASTEVLVVFFHVTWDDRSKLFESVYEDAQSKIALDSPGSTVDTKMAEVECDSEYRTCIEQSAIVYPLLKIYRGGKHVADYKGMLDVTSILKAIRLYQLPPLVKLDVHSVVRFTNGQEPMPAAAFVDTSILGWFKNDAGTDFELFKKVATKNHGRFLFGYAVGEETKKLLENIQESPEVQAFIRNDEYRNHDFFAENYNEKELDRFLNEVSLSPFGELTPSNFPIYRSLGQPLLLLFTKAENRRESNEWKILIKIIQTEELMLKGAWMNMDLPVIKSIRRSYLGQQKGKQNEIVIVDHDNEEVYCYNGTLETLKAGVKQLKIWLRAFTKKALTPTSYLNRPKWKPIQEGFDFFKIIESGLNEDFEDEENDEYHDKKYVDGSSPQTQFHGMKSPSRVNADNVESSTDEGSSDIETGGSSESVARRLNDDIESNEALYYKHDEF